MLYTQTQIFPYKYIIMSSSSLSSTFGFHQSHSVLFLNLVRTQVEETGSLSDIHIWRMDQESCKRRLELKIRAQKHN